MNDATDTNTATEENQKQYLELEAEFEDWSGSTKNFKFRFAKPTKTMIERTNSDVAKGKQERAYETLLVGLAHPDEKDNLKTAMQDYPGLKTSFCERIYERLGYASVGK